MRTIIVNSVAAHMGGAVSYLNGVLPRLATLEEYRFLVLVNQRIPLGAEDLPGDRVSIRSIPSRSKYARVLWDQFGTRRAAKRAGAAAMLSLLNHGPRFSGVPQVILQANHWYFTREQTSVVPFGGTDLWFRRRLAIAACRGSRVVIVPSRAMKRDLESWLNHPRVAVLPHAIDTDFYRGDARNLSTLPPGLSPNGGPKIAYISNLAAYKGHGDLLTAFRSVLTVYPDAQLALTIGPDDRREAGPGDLARALVDAARELEGVHFLGEQRDPRVVRSLYEWADIVAFPSRMESFGLPLLEAMSMGKPVVTSAVPALVELAGGTALLHAPGDSDELAEQLLRLAGDPELCRDHGERGRPRALEYGWDRYVPRLMALIDEAIASVGSSA